jgi:outer membrane protein TolC
MFKNISLIFFRATLKLKLLLTALLFPVIIIGQSQQATDGEALNQTNSTLEARFNPLVDNIQEKLPPLEVLIDSAVKNAPGIRMREAEVSLARFRLKERKWSWTRHFGLISNFNYGNNYNFSINETSGSAPSEFITTRAETAFQIGFFLRFPAFDAINRKNEVNIGKREIEKTMLLREEMVRETSQEVILVYQDLLLHQDLLKVKNEAQITSEIQVKMAEKEFLNGKITIAELSRLTEMHSINVYNFKKDRVLFYRQYLILEQLVGMKFNILNEIY